MTIAEKITRAKADIDAVYDAGYAKGQAEGGDTTAAYDEGFEAGKQAEYDAFWDAFQANGARLDYQYAFANSCWNDNTFNPKYDIICKGYGCTNMFWSAQITNLEERLQEMGVILDTSQNHYFSSMFQNATTAVLPELDLRIASNTLNAFLNCKAKIIRNIIVSENTPFTNSTFQGCATLEEIRFEGVIGQNNLNMQWSTKLSKASIESIINALSTTTSGLTVTLSKTAKEAAFTADEWAALIATRPNWTISLV